ncbi:MAG: hypothetical protein MJY44_02230 [Bacteroidales bacterium]|nr:hypothetical protein [Bacteroidales bacterium]
MKKLIYVIPALAMAAVAVSCNDRFVPEVADIEAREPATKTYAPDMQQNRIYDAVDATLSNLGNFDSIAEAIDEISQIKDFTMGREWEDADSKEFIADIIARFNSMSTLSGTGYSSLYELSKFKGDYVLNEKGIFRKDNKNGIKVNIGDEFFIDAVFSSAEKEYRIGKVDSLPVKYTLTEVKSVEINGDAYQMVSVSGNENDGPVTYEPSNLTVKLPKSIAVSVTRKGRSEDLANLTLSLDGNYRGEFISSYLGTFDLKKVLDEVTLDLGLTLTVGGYGLNINRMSYNGSDAELDLSISKDKTNVAVVTVSARGIKARKNLPVDRVSIVDEISVVDKVSIVDETGFGKKDPSFDPDGIMSLLAVLVKSVSADELDAYVNLAGMLQIKASGTNLDDLLARLDSVRNNVTFMNTILGPASPREPRPIPDSLVVRYPVRIDSIPAIIVRGASPADTAAIEKFIDDFNRNVSCKVYFGSKIMQSELVLFKAGSFDDTWYFGPGLKFEGVDTPVSLAAMLTGKSPIGMNFYGYNLAEGQTDREAEFAEDYPNEYYLNLKAYQMAQSGRLRNHVQAVRERLKSILDKIRKK